MRSPARSQARSQQIPRKQLPRHRRKKNEHAKRLVQKAKADAKKKAVKDKKSARKKENKEKKAEKENNDAEAAAKKAKMENTKLAEQIHKKLAGCHRPVAEVISRAMYEHLPAVIKEPFATGAGHCI